MELFTLLVGVTIGWVVRSLIRVYRGRDPFVLRFGDRGFSVEGENLMARLTTEEKRKVRVVPRTPAGHEAKIDGDVAFESSDESIARIEPVDNESAYVIAVGEGVAQITAQFDADLGEGTRTIELTGAVEVVGAEATTGELVFDEPEQQ